MLSEQRFDLRDGALCLTNPHWIFNATRCKLKTKIKELLLQLSFLFNQFGICHRSEFF